jgi:hypothetical protein
VTRTGAHTARSMNREQTAHVVDRLLSVFQLSSAHLTDQKSATVKVEPLFTTEVAYPVAFWASTEPLLTTMSV